MSCRWWRALTHLMVAILSVVGLLAQGQSEERRPEVTRAVRQALSRPWREIPRRPQPPGPDRAVPNQKLGIAPGQPLERDPLVDFQQQVEFPAGAPAQTVGVFQGLSDDDNAAVVRYRVVPPDTVGDVGGPYYVQMVNSILAVYEKASGARIFGPVPNNSIWDGFGGPCDLYNDGDPIIFYDHLAGRWVLSQFAIVSNSSGMNGYQCFAVSETSDPTGAYHLYEYLITPGGLNDYPKIGLWPDGYYLTVNQFVPSGLNWLFLGTRVVAFEREQMLVGGVARGVAFSTSSASLQPAHLEGPEPSVSRPNTLVNLGSGSYRLWDFRVDWNDPLSSTFEDLGTVPTDAFDSSVCCIPQPAGETLDSLAGRAMYPAQYRDFGAHQTIVFNHTVDVGGNRAGVRWVELRNNGGGWQVYQTGTFAPNGTLHYWMGSAGMDGNGNLALGYSVSGTSLEPSVRYTSRLASDPLDVMTGGETDIQVGTGVQLSNSYNRWGDYSSLSVDSEDDCTFYYTQEYYANDGAFDFNTVVGSFRLPGCTAAPDCDSDADCNDGNPCTTDSCNSGSCSYGSVSCDDQDACTIDSCDPGLGCVSEPVSCDDGDACTTDGCDSVSGCYYEAVTCNDGDLCTSDSCDPESGCQYLPDTCDDQDACTIDSCDNSTGCNHQPLVCEAGTTCVDGACVLYCGNGTCDPGEDCVSCGDDCDSGTLDGGAVCGNGQCEAGDGEDCITCPLDCDGLTTGKPSGRFCCGSGGSCADALNRCEEGTFTCTEIQEGPGGSYCCGDAVCGVGESIDNCSLDCSAAVEVCSDGSDNDGDGLADCLDPDCAGDPLCNQCLPGGSACTSDDQCCSQDCATRGKSGNRTCK